MEVTNHSVKQLGEILLDVGATLMSSGASTSRIRVTVERIAEAYHCDVELLITNRAIILALEDSSGHSYFSSLKRTNLPGVNFRVVSGISRMSWRVTEEHWTLEQIEQELERLNQLSRYPRMVILLAVSMAGAAFCRLVGGTSVEMVTAFVATLVGLWVRQEAMRLKYNFYLCIFFASTVSSLVAGLAVKLHLGAHPDFALSTSVLYLVPGVPLINSISDLIDGNIMNGVMRGVSGFIISFAIAAGLLISFLAYNIQ